MSNPNYIAVYLQNKYSLIEGDACKLSFCVYDEDNNLVTSLSGFKFTFLLDLGGQEVEKKDANYSDGGDDQIKVTDEQIDVYIDTNDTDEMGNEYVTGILQMVEISSSKEYTLWRKKFSTFTELLDF